MSKQVVLETKVENNIHFDIWDVVKAIQVFKRQEMKQNLVLFLERCLFHVNFSAGNLMGLRGVAGSIY